MQNIPDCDISRTCTCARGGGSDSPLKLVTSIIEPFGFFPEIVPFCYLIFIGMIYMYKPFSFCFDLVFFPFFTDLLLFLLSGKGLAGSCCGGPELLDEDTINKIS